MRIDQSAPLVGRSDVLINASLERVWRLQTNVNYWSAWQPNVLEAEIDGRLAVGTVFRWRTAQITVTSRIGEVAPKQRIGWTSDWMGLHAIRNWEFERRDDGIHVMTELSLSGWLAEIVGLFVPHYLDKFLEKSVETLKDAAEMRRRL